jgi:Zn-dependent protease
MSGFRIGRLLGISIEIKYSFFLLMLLAFYGGILHGLGGSAVIVLLFGCASVLVHELAHAFCARALSLPVASISLHALGGETRLAGLPKRASDEILIALAGPFASLLLAGIGGLWLLLTNSIWAELCIAINLLLAGVNMIPALPLDGGRVVRGLISMQLNLAEATKRTVWASRAIAVILTVAGPLFGLWYSLILGPLLWLGAGSEQQAIARWVEGNMAGLGASVSVLDADGKPADGRHAALGSTYVIEEHKSFLGQRWVVRDFAGNVLLVTDTPLGHDAPLKTEQLTMADAIEAMRCENDGGKGPLVFSVG